MKHTISRFATVVLLVWNICAQAQGEESDNTFYKGVTAYRANCGMIMNAFLASGTPIVEWNCHYCTC